MNLMSETIATVNGNPILRSDFDNAVQGYSMELHHKTMDQLAAQEQEAIRALALEKLLARELIFQQALKEGVIADEAAVEAEKQKIIANFPSEDEFYATLAKAGIDPSRYHRMIRQDLTVNQMSARRLADIEEASAEKIEAFYRRHPEKMVQPVRVRASHILLRISEGGREDTLERLRALKEKAAQEDFAHLAREHSQCPSAARGGDLGFFKHSEMVKSFADAAFSQPVGEIGEVVETQFGLHLIQVTDTEPERQLSLEEATPLVRKFLQEEAGAVLLKDWVEELKAEAQIVHF
jgi:peptidyl-prolyl cis-trans isomerase C